MNFFAVRIGNDRIVFLLQSQHLFTQIFRRPERIFGDSLSKSPFRNALSVHPIKERSYMLHTHHYFLTKYLLDVQHRAAVLNHRFSKIRKISQHPRNNTAYLWSNFDGLMFVNNSLPWEFSDYMHVYGLSEEPLAWVSGPLQSGRKNIIIGVMKTINDMARQLQELPEDFKKVHTMWHRNHPTFGLQYTMGLETLLRSSDASKTFLPRRTQRNMHFQQRYGPLLTNILTKSSDMSSEVFLHFIVPLAGRFDTFIQFLSSFKKSFLKPRLSVSLLVVYFPDVSSPARHKRIFAEFKASHAGFDLSWSELRGDFSRARALEFGASYYENNSLLFFADVDLTFDKEFFYRCQAGSIPGKRAYFPMMFSQFNPDILNYNSSVHRRIKRSQVAFPYDFARLEGVWRKYSFGPACVYSNDYFAVGGFNTSIQGWGVEDLDFFEKCLRHDLEVLRAPDLGLVHTYHKQSNCKDPRMNSEQAQMCEMSRRQNIASEASLVDYMLDKGYL